MIKFDIITIFPSIIEAYFNESILKHARERGLIDVKVWNLRDFAKDEHQKGLPATMPARNASQSDAGGRSFGRVDDRPFGGGPGMVMKIEPLVKALKKASLGGPTPKLVVLLEAGGKQFNSETAARFGKKYKHIILICGRYEGVDERVKKLIHDLPAGPPAGRAGKAGLGFRIQEISVGPYVLTGGELPAMIIVDAISRHIPGVLGKAESLEEHRHGVGVPVYTRPETFIFNNKKFKVPSALLSGHHKKIEEWRLKHKKMLK